jgi:hypothetical protein
MPRKPDSALGVNPRVHLPIEPRRLFPRTFFPDHSIAAHQRARKNIETKEIVKDTDCRGVQNDRFGTARNRLKLSLARVHRSELECSHLNDETIIKQGFMKLPASAFRLTRLLQSIKLKSLKRSSNSRGSTVSFNFAQANSWIARSG